MLLCVYIDFYPILLKVLISSRIFWQGLQGLVSIVKISANGDILPSFFSVFNFFLLFFSSKILNTM